MISAVLSAILLALSANPHADVKFERIAYHGWPDCYRMSNGIVELVYVPQIGRIMRYSNLGGDNFLWENSRLAGMTSSSAKAGEWANYGGDKLWPAPQSIWNWPPDPILDGSPYSVTVEGKSLVVAGPTSPKSGVRFTRRITMERESSMVHIKNMMINTSERDQNLALWEIAQTNDPDLVMVPLEPTPMMPLGWAPYDKVTIDADFARVNKGRLDVHRNPKKGFKLGSASSKGWLTAVRNGFGFEMHVRKAPGTYVDDGKFLEVYASSNPDKYVELEITGPITMLPPNQACTLEMTWKIEMVGKA
jgi:hypothetical protein